MSRALLLDLDGTLCDSLPGLRDAYTDFLVRRGCTGTEAEFASLNGATLGGIVALLRTVHALDGESLAELELDYARLIARARAASLPVDGASELLGAARCCGWRVAVVTSGTRAGAQEWLEARRLSDRVDVVIGGDSVAAPKPAPDGYLLALAQLGCAAEHSVGVEDSSAGLAALVAAGLEAFEFAPFAEVHAGYPTERAPSATRIAKLAELIPRVERAD